MKKILFITIVISLFFSIAFAQQPDSTLCSSGYKVYFGNGIFNDPGQAYISSRSVESILGANYNGEPVSVYVSYNPSSMIGDLLEVFAQKIVEDPTLSWQLFFRFIRGQFINEVLMTVLEDYFNVNGTQQLAQAVASLSSPQAYTDPVVVAHAATYYSDLLSGKRVLVVAHSQGNLYANAIYRRLQNMNTGDFDLNAFGIAGVASPANFVATGDGYVTSDTDHVIELLRFFAPATLPDNDQTVPFFTPFDLLGHGFVEIYTNSQFAIRAHTSNVIFSTMNRLSNVSPHFSGGPITATLTWSSPGDIDLHTYEPNYHVFYADRNGQVGYLDRDDTTGTGPEHYYTSCQNFRIGNYSFGVNYYSGSGSKQATIKLSVLGIDYPARAVTVTTPRYSSGNNSPIILWRVSITQDANGEYSATIQ